MANPEKLKPKRKKSPEREPAPITVQPESGGALAERKKATKKQALRAIEGAAEKHSADDGLFFASEVPARLLQDDQGNPIEKNKVKSWTDENGRMVVNTQFLNEGYVYRFDERYGRPIAFRPVNLDYDAVVQDGGLRLKNKKGDVIDMAEYEKRMVGDILGDGGLSALLESLKKRETMRAKAYLIDVQTGGKLSEHLMAIVQEDEELMNLLELSERPAIKAGMQAFLLDVTDGSLFLSSDTVKKIEEIVNQLMEGREMPTAPGVDKPVSVEFAALLNPEKRKKINRQVIDRIIERVIAGGTDKPYAVLSPPISAGKISSTREDLAEFYKKYGRKPGVTIDAVNLQLHGSESKPRSIAKEDRKAYISPPYDHLPEFLEQLFVNLEKRGVKYIKPKIHQGDLRFDKAGNLIAQKQNTVCFYFRNDREFLAFAEVVEQTEKASGIKLLSYPDAVSYGQLLGGKINFGIDTADQSFDEWMRDFYDFINEDAQKWRDLEPEEKKKYLKKRANAFLKKNRQINIDKFLDVNEQAYPTQELLEKLFKNIIPGYGKTKEEAVLEQHAPGRIDELTKKMPFATNGKVRIPFNLSSTREMIIGHIRLCIDLARKKRCKVIGISYEPPHDYFELTFRAA